MTIDDIAIGFVAVIHFAIAGGEILLLKNPLAFKLLEGQRFTPEEARKVAPVVANAGVYNAFIASGLVWSILAGTGSLPLKCFFLSCVVIAGIFGAATIVPTINWKPLVLQTLPALIAGFLVWFTNKPA